METMLAGLLYGAEDLRLVQIPIPEPGSGQALIKIHACSICPTDVRKYRLGDKDHGIRSLPFNLGHEWTGEVVKLGPGTTNVKLGERRVGGGMVGYAQYAVIPSGPRGLDFNPLIPDNVPYEVASMTEPFSDCIHSLRDQGKATLGDYVVIVGAGPMALMHVMVAKAMGTYVIVSEPDPVRRDWAKKFGADVLIDPTQEDWPKRVKQITGGPGADVIILSIGTPVLVNQALQATANGARVVLFGGTPTDAPMTEIEQNLIHYHEVSLVGSEWCGIVGPPDPRTYRLGLKLMSTGQAPLDQLITHRYALADLYDAFKVAQSREGLKVILFPWGVPEHK